MDGHLPEGVILESNCKRHLKDKIAINALKINILLNLCHYCQLNECGEWRQFFGAHM